MNVAKHMEMIFVAAVALASASALASVAVPAHSRATLSAPASAKANVNSVVREAAAAPMAVVTITGKRLSAAQKAALGN